MLSTLSINVSLFGMMCSVRPISFFTRLLAMTLGPPILVPTLVALHRCFFYAQALARKLGGLPDRAPVFWRFFDTSVLSFAGDVYAYCTLPCGLFVGERQVELCGLDPRNVALLILFVVFPTSTSVLLECYNVDGDFDDGRSYLVADYSLSADNKTS